MMIIIMTMMIIIMVLIMVMVIIMIYDYDYGYDWDDYYTDDYDYDYINETTHTAIIHGHGFSGVYVPWDQHSPSFNQWRSSAYLPSNGLQDVTIDLHGRPAPFTAVIIIEVVRARPAAIISC